MADQMGLDWPRYFRSLRQDEVCTLATWLGAQRVHVGEFMEVVDRAYAAWPGQWGRPEALIGRVGLQIATGYAFRKRRFARLVAMLEEAMASGALPGEVAPQELDLPVKIQTKPRSVAELLAALDRVTHSRV